MELHIGEIKYNKNGSKMKVIKYKNYENIMVEFEDGYKISTTYDIFKSGSIKNPNDRTIYNKGYLGEGKYNTKDNQKYYRTWYGIMRRCYDKNFQEKHKSYIGCSVSEEWLNFQNFAKWYDENYYEIEGQRIELDKDILHKGNKIYSPENCIFVLININNLFIKRQNDRGKYPIGVYWDENKNKYISKCTINNKRKTVDQCNTPEEAFYTYKIYKEQYIKDIANDCRNKYLQFPQKLYNTMINYKVEITD